MDRAWLERRNALWQTLRQHTPGEVKADPQVFESALSELQALIGWERRRILAGLGLSEVGLADSD